MRVGRAGIHHERNAAPSQLNGEVPAGTVPQLGIEDGEIGRVA
jgi:hypothetical protein